MADGNKPELLTTSEDVVDDILTSAGMEVNAADVTGESTMEHSQTAEPLQVHAADAFAPRAICDENELLRQLTKEKERLEQIAFIRDQELSEVKQRLADVSTQSSQLSEELSLSRGDLLEKERKFRLMETARDDMALKKIQHEEEAIKYKMQKEERDDLVQRITREKLLLTEEVVTLKEKMKEIALEKAQLVGEKKSWEREKREKDFEVQRTRDEAAVLEESKKWLLKEIAERDNRVSQMRIESSNKDIVWQNEKNRLYMQKDELNDKVIELDAELTKTKKELDEKIKTFTKELETKRKQVEEAEGEMRVHEQIAREYKSALADANQAIEEQKLAYEQNQTTVFEVQQAMGSLHAEMATKEDEMERELKDKESRILELEEELDKANELLKSRHNLGAMSDEDLAKVAPAAAETSRLLRSGMTLSQLYREHARVVGELEEQRILNKQLEAELREVVEEIEHHAPSLSRQKEQLDKTLEHNDRLVAQLEKASEDRAALVNEKDSAKRELAFTRVELEKFQREHTKLREQTAQLLFVIESEQRNRTGQPPIGGDEQKRMYTSIVGLQQRIVQLELDLENSNKQVQSAVAEAVQVESARLREELDLANHELGALRTAMGRLQTAISSVEQQRDRLRDIVDRGSLDPEAASLRCENSDLKNELNALRARAVVQEERINNMQQEQKKLHQISEDRLAQQRMVETELTQAKLAISAELQLQKQVAAETKKELDKFVQTFHKQTEELQKARSKTVEAEQRLCTSNETLLQQQDRIAHLQIECRSLREDLERARSSMARTEGELKVHQDMARTHQTLIAALGDAERRLQLNEDMKVARLESVLESTVIERDQLRLAKQNLEEQVSNASRMSGQAEARLTGERDLARTQLSEARDQLRSIEVEVSELRTRLSAAQQQAAKVDSSHGMNPERLANRNTYLEAQVEEMRAKLSETEAKLLRSQQEVAQLASTSSSVESSLKQHTENAQETIGRLNSLLKAGEQRQVELTSDLNALRDELQRQIEVIAAKESEWGTNRAQLEQKIAVFEVKLADANALHVDTERRLEEARVESTEYRNKASEMEARLTSLLAEKESLDVIVESVRGQLTLVQTDLQASEARVSEEVRNRESALDAEKHRMAEMEQKVQLGEEALRAANQRAEELIVHISKLSNELSVREAAAASSSTDLSEESIQAMHHVLRFLREEKDKAQERAMQAEVEMKRLAAEAESMRDDRDRMAQAVRAREQEAEQNRAALAQRSELLARLESMSTVQKENAILKSERERLAKVLSETDARRINLERALGEMRTARSSAEQRAASATSLADARARELDAVRQRAGETAQERIAKMQQDVNEARERAEKAAADRDAEVRKAQAAEQSLVEAQNAAKQSEMKLKDVETRFVQIKNLALKYRTESAKLKEENEKLNAAVAAGAAHPAATDVAAASVNEAAVQESQRLHSEIEELRKQYEADKAELQGQIDQFESEKTEFAMRSQAMDNLLKSTKSRLEATVKDLEGEKEAHARTRVQLSAVVRQVAAASQPEMPPAAPTASSTTPSTASVQAARALPPLPTPSPAPLSSTASSSFTPSVPTPSLTSVTSSAVSTTAIASASLEVAPTLPTLPTSSTAPSEPGPPVPKPSIFSFNPNASSFQSSFHGSIFGTSASRPISTMSSSSSSSVTVAAPQSTSPAPSVPQMNTESGMVASFFGRRPTEPLLPRSPVCSSSSSAAPADPSPAPLQHTPLHIQQRNTTTAPATPSVPERSTSPVEPLVGTPTTSNLRSSSILFGTSATSIPRLLVLENEPISSVPIQQQPDSGEEQAGSSVMIRDEDSASGAEVSQDGLPSAITSSSGEVVGRKRTASSMSSSGHQDAKRQRESPGDEQISSSERNHDDNLLDEESRDAEPIIVGMDEDDEENAEDSLGVTDDGEELPEMNEGAEIQQDHEEAPQEDDDDVQVVSSDSDDNAVESDFDEGNYRHEIPANVQEGVEDDYGMDEEEEEYGDEEEEEEMYDEEPEEEEDMEEDVGERDAQMRDAEVNDEEPQLADQSEHDDGGDADEQTQDAENAELVGVGEEREAASAVEEADDEGRDAPSDSQQRTPMHGGEEESENFAQPSQSSSAQKPRREPITYDVATSSNERSGEEAQPSSSGVQQNVRRAPRQLYAAPGIREGPSPPLGARPPGGVPRGGRSGGRHTTMSRRGGGRTMRR